MLVNPGGTKSILALLEGRAVEGKDRMAAFGMLLNGLAPKEYRLSKRELSSIFVFERIFSETLSDLEGERLVSITGKRETKAKKCRYEITKDGRHALKSRKEFALARRMVEYYSDKETVEIEADTYLLFPHLVPTAIKKIRKNLLSREYSKNKVTFPYTDKTVHMEKFLGKLSSTFFDEGDPKFIKTMCKKLGLDVSKYVPNGDEKLEDVWAIKDPAKKMKFEDLEQMIADIR